jgi:monoamine oxidase
MRRRDLIAGSLAGSILLPASSFFPGATLSAAPEKYDVIVIGGGLSGLNTAIHLSDSGAKVLLLEASDRFGGRVRTVDYSDGVIELGASQIGPSYARVRDMTSRLKVPLGEGAHMYAPYSFLVDDQLVTKTAWASSRLNRTVGAERERMPHTLRAMYLEERIPFDSIDGWLSPEANQYDVSLFEWLRNQGASDEAIRLIDQGMVDPGVYGISVLTMMQEAARSAFGLRALSSREDLADMDIYQRFAKLSSHVVGRMGAFPEAMAAHLGDSVRLEMPVTAIDMTATGSTVTCKDGSRFNADFVVSAIPFSVLRKIAITPGLSGEQADAVNTMPYGRMSQVWLRVKGEPYWEKDGIEASMWGNGMFTLLRQEIGYGGERELVSVSAIGPRATKLDALSPVERGQVAMDYLARVRPSTKDRLELVLAESWAQQTYIGGVRHSYTPGQVIRFRDTMLLPHERMHFAGEHTRRLEVGMESAMESGERAAIEILQRTSV